MHFKKLMLEFKKSTNENADAINESGFTNKSENDNVAKEAGGSDAAAAIASYTQIASEPLEGKDSPWNLKINQDKPNENGVHALKIYQRKHETLKNDLIRIDATFTGCD